MHTCIYVYMYICRYVYVYVYNARAWSNFSFRCAFDAFALSSRAITAAPYAGTHSSVHSSHADGVTSAEKAAATSAQESPARPRATACNVQRATACNVQRATDATCNVQRAACNVQRAACNVQPTADTAVTSCRATSAPATGGRRIT